MASSVTESKTTWSVGFSHAARPPDDGYTLTRFKRTDACTTDEGFTIIFLHGAGDGDGVNAWTNIWRSLLQNLPANCEVMLPSGPFVPPPQNAEGDPTLGWIRLQRWRGIGHNSNYRVPKEALQGLDDVAHQISQLVKSEGAHGRKVILGGFSQGGAVSVYAGLTTDCWPHIAGLFCLSGYLPQPISIQSPPRSAPPVLLLHGTADALFDSQVATAICDLLKQQGLENVTLKLVDGLGHRVNREELNYLSSWMTSLVSSPSPSHASRL
eukprot:TRINITY_DN3365_c0_g1_i5.p1 TRINITY_DN3365_c0_g1~~TRINITY_DN3365_c0_g1_i5.p1  ORF type:complete len:268 (+),score=30.05 TRINITY_DN3365_c0_g1_i5:54-857(+)